MSRHDSSTSGLVVWPLVAVVVLAIALLALWAKFGSSGDDETLPVTVTPVHAASVGPGNGPVVNKDLHADHDVGAPSGRPELATGLSMDELMTPGDLVGPFVALSREEAAWKDKHGVPGNSQQKTFYDALNAKQLERMARSGDMRAAVVAAARHRMSALQLPAGQILLESGLGAREDVSSSAASRRNAYLRLTESAEWKAYMDLLWVGVVHGSSWAAQEMSDAYKGPYGTCFDAVKCDAWTLVAWRMGEWGVDNTYPYANNDAVRHSSGEVFAYANRMWSDINTTRSEIGLPPLQIDLRPSYNRWMELETDGQIDGPIFRR